MLCRPSGAFWSSSPLLHWCNAGQGCPDTWRNKAFRGFFHAEGFHGVDGVLRLL